MYEAPSDFIDCGDTSLLPRNAAATSLEHAVCLKNWSRYLLILATARHELQRQQAQKIDLSKYVPVDFAWWTCSTQFKCYSELPMNQGQISCDSYYLLLHIITCYCRLITSFDETPYKPTRRKYHQPIPTNILIYIHQRRFLLCI